LPTRPLEALASIHNGIPLRERVVYRPGGAVRIVQMRDLDPELGLNFATLTPTDLAGVRDEAWLQAGDLLFSGKGSRFFAVALGGAPRQTVASPHLAILRIKDRTLLAPEYLAWVINGEAAQAYLKGSATGAVVQYVPRHSLSQLAVPLPSMEIQQRIATVAAAWRREKELTEQLTTLKGRWLNAALARLAEGKQP